MEYIYGALTDSSDDEEEDPSYDPTDDAEEPLEKDDYLSSDLRKQLKFTSGAKTWMKADTPFKKGNYICHICSKPIKKGEKVDMDHLPPWDERIKAWWKDNNPTSEDDFDVVVIKALYNWRGSVFAHATCNRSHAGESNWKQKWKSVKDWYEATGGPCIDKTKY